MAITIPQIRTNVPEVNQLQTNIVTALNPLLKNQIASGILLQQIVLKSGSNVINHTLNRKLTGWIITRIRSNATVYDTQDTNQTPDKNLLLTASANVTVDLYVF